MKNNLYDTLAEKWIKLGGTIWIYSDPHFSDIESYKLRGLLNVPDDLVFAKEQGESRPYDLYIEERLKVLDEMQVKRINSKVGKNDTIIFLGDIGDLEFVKKIKGYKVLIMGNHDKGASNYKRVIEHVTKCPKCGCTQLTSLGNNDGMSLYKTQCDNCHFIGLTFGSDFDVIEDNHLFDEVYEGPLMVNDRLILSHEPIEQLPKYMFNIHGHDHSKWFNSPQHLNVCAENINYTPVNLLNLLKTGLLKNIDSIHRCCIDKATKEKRKKELRKIDKQLKELYNK